MDIGFDHITIVVTDVDSAEKFFGLLGFERSRTALIQGPEMADYLGVEDIVADHITLRHTGAPIHQEVQLLHYRNPPVKIDSDIRDLGRTGWNHVCFRVRDLDETLDRLRAGGVLVRTKIMEFHDRRLVYVVGPEAATVELAEWLID